MGQPATKAGEKKSIEGAPEEYVAAAEEAGLRYVNDDSPGYTRKPNDDNFDYSDAEGKPIRDEQRLLRIKRLAIPPAWIGRASCRERVLLGV